MKISFDLDETLFVNPEKIQTEKSKKSLFGFLYKEKLRYGTISLMKNLMDLGHEIYIYTTSYRPIEYIHRYFKRFGIIIDIKNIINGDRHEKEVQRNRVKILPSKMPSSYGIDLHIDDDESVQKNGSIYGFKVILVKDQDDAWAEKILKHIQNV